MKKALIILAIVLLAAPAFALNLIQPTVHSFSSYEDLIDGGKRNPTRTVDRSGIDTAVLQHTSLVIKDAPVSFDGTDDYDSDQWQSVWWGTGTYSPPSGIHYRPPSAEWIIYDFGTAKMLDSAFIWPGSQQDHSLVSLKNFQILAANSPNPAFWQDVGGACTLVQWWAPGEPITSQAFVLQTNQTAYRYIKIQAQTSWLANGSVGFHEIGFLEAGGGPEPVIPEPAGLGLAGVALLALRRRRS
jgi:MYXO-CTERM domain-containing protein